VTQHVFGQTEMVLVGGQVWGNVPLGLLFSGFGSFQRYFISVRNTFETMGINEFMSSRYLAFFYAHKFTLHIGKSYRPEVVLRHGMGVGALSNPQSHAGIEVKSMEKGYYESGVEFNNILSFGFNGYGVALFYRYGPYAHENASDNFLLKFTLTFVF
jgi:hypothetical protein